jgi:polar amino acid transport system substrate-binding protein
VTPPEKYGIALPERSPLREEINRALLHLLEEGVYDDIYTRWFGQAP